MMSAIAANLARLRLDRRLTQARLAERAGLSRVAVGKIERGAVVPRAGTLVALARALDVPVRDLIGRVRPLRSVRFRARSRLYGREQILAEVSRWLDNYGELEDALGRRHEFSLQDLVTPRRNVAPPDVARRARERAALDRVAPVGNICRFLEEAGVKVLLLDKKRDSFFGLSVGPEDRGPAVVVNVWDRISVERWIFTAAHELGHLLLHPMEFDPEETRPPKATEKEADSFASHFLMPEPAFQQEWNATRGASLLWRVLTVKRIFRVSYRTVLFRLYETERAGAGVWAAFQAQHRRYFGRTLKKADEPNPLAKSEFFWSSPRAGEPAALLEHDFRGLRLARLVRHGVEQGRISLGRGAEILGLPLEEMRVRAREWAE